MMEMIKKNIVLVIVLSIAMIVSIVLLIVVFMKYNELRKAIDQVEQTRDKIKQLNNETPAPVEENLRRIKVDTAEFEKRVSGIQKIFGIPYRHALQKYAMVLLGINEPEKAEEELKEKWRVFWKKNAKKSLAAQTVLKMFIDDMSPVGKEKSEKKSTAFDGENKKAEGGESSEAEKTKDLKTRYKEFNDKLEKARSAFIEAFAKESAEKITRSNFDEILLESLGNPRYMSSNDCKTFLFSMQDILKKKLKNAKIVTPETVLTFSFGEYFGLRMPIPENIPIIVKHWRMLEDLVDRLVAAKVATVESISKVNTLKGEEEKGYLHFKYSIRVSGTLDSLRALFEQLRSAYLDNKIYVINDVELEKTTDEVVKIRTSRDGASNALDERFKNIARQGHVNTGQTELTEEEIEAAKEMFGRPIIGVSKKATATITFDYVIYVGGEQKVYR